MAGVAGGKNPVSEDDPSSWEELCDRRAETAAYEFARWFHEYVADNRLVSAPCVAHRDAAERFVSTFLSFFEQQVKWRSGDRIPNGEDSSHAERNEEYSDPEDCPPLATSQPKRTGTRFFRRFSFRGFRRRKRTIRKQQQPSLSNEGDVGIYITARAGNGASPPIPRDSGCMGRSKTTKLSKIVVECLKEGTVTYLTGDSLEGAAKWEKCRLALVKTAGGFMLEFYSPPKSIRPKNGLFCFLIAEAREATTLEMPDKENTFVLKADGNVEYIIEARNAVDMCSWLEAVKEAMNAPPVLRFSEHDRQDKDALSM
jgi:hypothetical protein